VLTSIRFHPFLTLPGSPIYKPKNINRFKAYKSRSDQSKSQQAVFNCLLSSLQKNSKMTGSKVAIFICISLALTSVATADLLGGLDLGNILKPVTGLLNGVVGNLVGDLNSLLKDVTGLVADLLKTLIAIINQIVKILNIPAGQDPLAFVQNLVSQLEPIVNQLLGTVSSGVGEVIDDVSNYYFLKCFSSLCIVVNLIFRLNTSHPV
jgi:hypothetical protein